MKKTILIFITFLSLTSFGQNNIVLLFDFDTTKVYIKYIDIAKYITKENAKIKELNKLVIKNDTILIDRYFIHSDQQTDSLNFDLNKELYAAINNKKAIILFQNKPINAFYSKKIKYKRNNKKYFKGIYYYDTISKKHFFTKTIYQRRYCSLYR